MDYNNEKLLEAIENNTLDQYMKDLGEDYSTLQSYKLPVKTKFIKLSGGEKRLLDVAIMLAMYDLATTRVTSVENLLFMDESLDSLDTDNGISMIGLLKQLSEKKAIYLISHSEFWKSQDFDTVVEF